MLPQGPPKMAISMRESYMADLREPTLQVVELDRKDPLPSPNKYSEVLDLVGPRSSKSIILSKLGRQEVETPFGPFKCHMDTSGCYRETIKEVANWTAELERKLKKLIDELQDYKDEMETQRRIFVPELIRKDKTIADLAEISNRRKEAIMGLEKIIEAKDAAYITLNEKLDLLNDPESWKLVLDLQKATIQELGDGVQETQERMVEIEKKLMKAKDRVSGTEEKLGSMEQKLAKAEEKVASRDDLIKTFMARLAEKEKRLQTLTEKLKKSTNPIHDLDKTLIGLEERRHYVDGALLELKNEKKAAEMKKRFIEQMMKDLKEKTYLVEILKHENEEKDKIIRNLRETIKEEEAHVEIIEEWK